MYFKLKKPFGLHEIQKYFSASRVEKLYYVLIEEPEPFLNQRKPPEMFTIIN